jgi:hypothetical protein
MRRAGHEAGQDPTAYGADEIDDCVVEDDRGLDEQVAGGLQGDEEAGPVGVGVRARRTRPPRRVDLISR